MSITHEPLCHDQIIPPMEILSPAELLLEFPEINIAAPMVRYSKLPFRQLVTERGNVHVTHTPMLLAKEFARSHMAREADFSTNDAERGIFSLLDDGRLVSECLAGPSKPQRRIRGCLIAQFAANDPEYLASAAELIRPYVDAVDVNCGCPQKWAYKEEIGSWLLRNPEVVSTMVKTVKARVDNIPVHIKIRIDPDLKNTERLVRTAIMAGVDCISVHGRTRHQPSASHPVSLEHIAFAREMARGQVPIVANGDVFTLEDARRTREVAGVSGVMSARGLLENPALFTGCTETPKPVVQRFVEHSVHAGLIFPLFHRHCFYMLESSLRTKSDRLVFNALSSHAGIIAWLRTQGILQPP